MGVVLRVAVKVYGKPSSRAFINMLVLTTDDWDDYGTKAYYHLAYFDAKGLRADIGTVKILQFVEGKKGSKRVADRTVLPSEFDSLGEDFISLGQGEDYYRRLNEVLDSEQCVVFLKNLRDIAWQPDLASPFEPTSAYRNSMMRSNGAERARRFGQAIVLGEEINESFSFPYGAEIEGAQAAIQVSIPFDSADALPGRIVGIIGRNAVGETQFLATLATDLCQIGRSSGEGRAARDKRFGGSRPLFTRVLAISYSAFDRFARPRSVAASYVYCGIRTENGGLSRKGLAARYRANQRRIREMARTTSWVRHIEDILGERNPALIDSLDQETNGEETVDDGLAFLSSGQSILVHFVTSLLAWLEPNSLVLFDEPETHLHPNAVASLFNVLTSVLDEYGSYAIVATHSPIVIQEIPARRVIVFEREGNLTLAKPLGLESFGESVAELTRHVFETNEIRTLYRRTLQRLSREEPLEATLARFEMELSLSAQAYLIAQHERDGQ